MSDSTILDTLKPFLFGCAAGVAATSVNLRINK